ncbi:hypothetical protein AR457_40835 [Streptomyces agglomeratus]|uniref:hypothetical protein n=1 Tax=Streptomyces agglomeratus TaxID=285458 RepID=UPI000854FAAC|nr:hypothetical protein [Streptomyces agglomeratus]OEJ21783.1 hypothetical protein AR457_40835 [Streptomyces agglomeratus]
MTVVGPDGEIVKDAAGNPITVDPRTGDPDFDPAPPCPKCPAPEPPAPDAGDTHTTGIDDQGMMEESVTVTEDSPFTP